VIALLVATALQAAQGPAAGVMASRLPPRERLNAQEELRLAEAESLFYARQLPQARRVAERLEDRHPNNPDVLLLLGRIHLDWPVIGRYKAESLFTRVGRIDSLNPEPFYLVAEVGDALGGEEGDNLIRRGLIGALAANPDYRDSWQRWESVPQRDPDRLLMVGALARHAGFRTADYRRAQMLVRMNRNPEGAGLLDSVVRRSPEDAGALAWLARARFANDEDSAGVRAYDAALRYATNDTGRVLWKQVRGIATVAERDTFLLTLPAGYSGFFRRFWARRDPDLATPINRRFAEHFHRLAVVTHEFALQHAGSRWFHSSLFRARGGETGLPSDPNGYLEGAYATASEQTIAARSPSVRDEQVRAGLLPRADLPDASVNLEDDIDDRGRIYLRHGKPDDRNIGPHAVSETWTYLSAGGRPLRVSFLQRSGGEVGAGDMVITAMAWGEPEAAAALMGSDHTSVARNDMDFSFRTATFRAADGRRTELLVLSDSLDKVGVLLDSEGREADRRSAPGTVLWLTGRPTSYALMVDAHNAAGQQSHYRGSAVLPDYSDGQPSVSSLLLAPGRTPAVRDSMVSAVPMRLDLPANAPVRVYAEVYGLARDSGVARYRAEYRFERTDGAINGGEREQDIAFDREQPAAGRFIETLVIDPDRLPPGRYVLRLRIIDQRRNAATVTSQIQFRLR
jgi:hypothetical protein